MMLRRMGLSATLMIVTMLGMALLQPVSVVRLTTGDGESVLCARLRRDSPITLSFTHSMYGGFVRETWIVDERGRLVRQQIVTENAAAAEYYATDGRVGPAEEGFEVLAPPFSTDELVIRPGGIGDHRLTVGTSVWQLSRMFGDPVQVRITGERVERVRLPGTCNATAGATNLHTKEWN